MFSQYTIFNMKENNTLNYTKSAATGFFQFSKGLKNEFERAVVNGPSGFEPLKFYCISPLLGQNYPESLHLVRVTTYSVMIIFQY